MRPFSNCVPLAVLVPLFLCAPHASAEDWTFHHENVMGTSFELVVEARDEIAASRAEARGLAEVDRLTRVFSGYDASSEFSRWQSQSGGRSKVSSELFEVLQASDRWRSATGGAFDPRAEIFSQLWSVCEQEGRTPNTGELAAARSALAGPAWRLDSRSGTAERLKGAPLTLNAIAKGYIVEKACAQAMDTPGVRGLLINIGGDLRVCDAASRRIGVAAAVGDSESSSPVTWVEVRDRAVATSGSSQRGFRIGGRRYSHIIDPRTGLPAAGVLSASVVARSSVDADALATALNVLEIEEALRVVEAHPDAACLIVAADGRVFRSRRWSAFEVKTRPVALNTLGSVPPSERSAEVAGSTSWGEAYELRVDFEINRPAAEGGRYRRPYIAIWVEDSKGFPVRNLLLWVSQGGSGPFQWLPDLKRWYKSDLVRKKVDMTDMVLTISRPTRPPGKYSVVWDGRDDHDKPLPPGDYVIAIDAAREHGTSQSIRFPVTIGDTPFRADDKGNVEIKSASVTFRKKTVAK